jgi:(S)-ureidoglycine aminohydrolase
MKKMLTLLTLVLWSTLNAQESPLPSQVFKWNLASPSNAAKIHSSTLFDGKGGVLDRHTMKAMSIPSHQKINIKKSKNVERFYIIKSGLATIQLNDQKITTLNRGSVVCVLPDDILQIANKEDGPLEIYEMSYQANTAMNIERGVKAGGSFITHWDDITFKPHDKGGVRQFFDRPTAMLNRFDIHVTQLNVGVKSHDPHTHVNEEIILMLEGNAEMQIGNDHQKANPGDAVLLGSNVLHNLTNIGNTPCLYFAIQWN